MNRIKTRLGISAIGVVAAICLLGSAQASELKCPLEIAVDQKATAPAPDWAVTYNGFKNELAGVTIYDGPPDQGASLVYDDQKTVGDTLVQTWKLAPNPRGYWLKCGYSNTAAEISERVPADATGCEAVYERNVSFTDGRRPIRSATCGAPK